MKKSNRLAAAAALCLVVSSGLAGASPDAWTRAEAEYEAQHYANALEAYLQLAAEGDARAAEVAGHMLSLGESLYGDAVRRDPVRASQLLSQAAGAGRPVAQFLLGRTRIAAREETGRK